MRNLFPALPLAAAAVAPVFSVAPAPVAAQAARSFFASPHVTQLIETV